MSVTGAPGRVHLTWLGQAGFAVRAGETGILIDPFVSDHGLRLAPPPSIETVAVGVDWLLVTHEHLDHLDLEFLPHLLEHSPGVRVVLPAPIAGMVAPTVGLGQLRTVRPGDHLELSADVSVDVAPACHAVEVGGAYGDGSRGRGPSRFVGFLLHLEGTSIYHAGDTLVTAELIEWLSTRRVDVALLPINGRDYFREEAGFVGNMDAREAVGLAARVGAHTMVPMHWDLIASNTVRPGAVLDEVAATGCPVHVLVLRPMKPFRLT